jgi:hypothetical protein
MFFVVMAFLLAQATGYAEVPQFINHQGKLTNATGTPLPSPTTVPMTFRIYVNPTPTPGELPLWTSAPTTVTVTNGLYNTRLEATSASPFPPALFSPPTGEKRFLEIEVNGEKMSPRQELGSVPYALNAGGVECAPPCIQNSELSDGSVTSAKIAAGAVGTTNLADGSVTTAKVASGAITSTKIATGAVGTTNLADASVTSIKIAGGAVGTTQVASNIDTTNDSWTGIGNITMNTGNVGIGTTGPEFPLDVFTNIDRYAVAFGDNTGSNSNLRVAGTAGGATGYGLLQMFQGNTAGRNLVLQRDAGNVGIGTASPASNAKLQVETPEYVWGISLSRSGTLIGGLHSNIGILALQAATGGAHVTVANDGNVGIGTTTPKSTLQVNGYIQLALGVPASTDCDESKEMGRMKVDNVNGYVYVCVNTTPTSTTPSTTQIWKKLTLQ